MANIKISQLTPKGANLASTDLLEISEFDGSGYVTKSVTGQEIIDAAASSGGVTDVTASAPLASSGGTTPDISIPQADAGSDGYLTSVDYISFTNKQDALTLTTMGTSGASTLVGSTLNIPQYSGGGGDSPTIVSISTTSGTPVTGTTSQTISSSLLIPANTFGTNGIMEIFARWQKTGTLGTQTLRMYVNTSATLTGATLIASILATSTNTFCHGMRTAKVSSNTLNMMTTATTSQTDLGAFLNTTITFNTSIDQYIIFTVQLVSVSDSSVVEWAKVTKYE